MLDWSRIDTVLLDMDGTLLDLHFDSHFWLEHVPLRYAQKHAISVEEAKAQLFPRMREMEGTIDWYCIDFWSRELDMDIALLKEEVDHLIAVFPHVREFLDAVRASGRRAVLVTNAHMKSLALKMERTRLAGHLDALVCAHDFGLPKEEARFWDALREREPFDPARTLFIDDSPRVLESARRYGIGQLLAVRRPDSKGPVRELDGFQMLDTFTQIMPH